MKLLLKATCLTAVLCAASLALAVDTPFAGTWKLNLDKTQVGWRYGHVFCCRTRDADHQRWRILRVQNGWQREQDTIRNGGVEEVGRSDLGGNGHGEGKT
jgi:hypothetical protein